VTLSGKSTVINQQSDRNYNTKDTKSNKKSNRDVARPYIQIYRLIVDYLMLIDMIDD
jgi:hypothetical protein